MHHGGAQRSRGLEQMIRMMGHLDRRFELHLVLVERDPDYLRELRARAVGDSRIRFVDAVPMLELPRFLNQFDVGVYILQPTNFNNYHALPNKFFEFVQARLAVAIGPSPEMARLVRRHDLGLVAPDFEPSTLAGLLTALDRPRLATYKRNTDTAARALSAQPARRGVLELVARCLGDSPVEPARTASAEAHP